MYAKCHVIHLTPPILRAALELFAERGYHATNVPLIAEHARVSVGTLYHYFENKEHVVTAHCGQAPWPPRGSFLKRGASRAK